MNAASLRRVSTVLLMAWFAACGSTQSTRPVSTSSAPPAASSAPTSVASAEPSGPPVPRESPPAVAPAQDIHFPPIARSRLRNGLEVDTVEYHTLPVVQIRLVARAAGSSADPANLPGLASFTGDMLKEGTRAHTSAQLAEAIDFLGASLEVTTTADATTVAVAVVRDHLDEALALLAEVVTESTFPQVEIDKLRRREIDRLTQESEDPAWLGRRAFYATLYGTHPYGHFDTDVPTLQRFTRADVAAFHRARFVAGSMYLAVVGDVQAPALAALAERTLGRIRRGTAPVTQFPALPARTTRQVVIVDRPESAQSAVRIGNLSLRRTSDDYIPLMVANQVLGGEASSRLFMDLRERRSLTYGAYSRVGATVDVGTFQASGAVRTPVTAEALAAFFEHLTRITHEAVPAQEMAESQSFLVDSFPLSVETPSEMAGLLAELRLYEFPDTYWDTYRARIGQVTPTRALEAAQRYIHPDQSVVVIVGQASVFQEAARHYGPVRVVDTDGRVLRELNATP